MKTPRKHAELIKAWADGAEIEVKLPTGWRSCWSSPGWGADFEYRIKPEPKPDVVIEEYPFLNGNKSITHRPSAYAPSDGVLVRYIFDAENGYRLKSVELVKP